MRLAYVALLLVACGGDDPVSYSAPVGINLKAKSADVVNATVQDEKGINTESGNPYGAFVTDATEALGGVAPGSLELDSVTLTLGAASVGVTSLDEVFTGQVDVLFITNDTNNTYLGAHVSDPAAGGPVSMTIDFDSGAWSSDDYAKLLSGSFKVVIRGDAAADFMAKGADADLQVTFTFEAFE